MLMNPMWRLATLMIAALLVLELPSAAADPAGMGELDANEVESTSKQSGNEAGEVIELDANQAEEEAKTESSENASEDVLADVAFGDPVDCVSTQRIRRTDVLSDREILFYTSGSGIYLNKLPHRCSGLRWADAFSYDVRGSQLCDIDLIRVVDTMGTGIRRGIACGLGKFLPVDEDQVPLIREQAKARAKAGD